jgi:PKD repeat protein
MKNMRFILSTVIAVVIILTLASCTSGSTKHTQQSLAPNIQSQLDALQLPQDVDPAVFAQLKDELARQLAQRGKAASTPPTGNANRVGNIHYTDDGGGFYTFGWEYRNSGDYDQNGTVGISDITPLAIHFGHTHTTDGLDRVFDLDNNGVGISDVTPIAQNYGVNCSWYWLQSAPAETGPWMDLGTREFADATGGTADWKEFSYSSNPSITEWFRIVAGDQDQTRGAVSYAFQIGGTFAPVITGVAPLTGGSGSTYAPTATNSGDPATSASWDFGGGATPNTSTDINPSVTLNAAGDYSASVTLTNAGGSDTFNFTLTVTPGGGTAPNITDVQPQTGQTGASYSPAATNTGDPATSAAWDFGGGATPNTSTDINPSVTLNAAGDYNASVTLYNASGNDTFNFTLTVTPAGGVTWNIHQISNWANLGYTSSLAAVNNRPAIAFIDELDHTTIYYARSTVMCPTATSDWIITQVVSNPADNYQFISLAEKLPGNIPVILTNEFSTTAAIYLQASSSTPGGASDWSTCAIDTAVLETGTITDYPTTTVTYLTSSGLTLAQPSVDPPSGPADWDKVLIDATAGHNSRLKTNFSSPYGAYIIHYEDTFEALMLSWCTQGSMLNAASWTTFQVSVSSGGFSGLYHDLAFDAFGKLLVNYTREDGAASLNIVSGGISSLEPADLFGFTVYTASDSPTEARGANLSFEVGYDNAYCAYAGAGGNSKLYLSYSPHTSGSTPFSWNLLTVDDVAPGDVRDTCMLVYPGDASTDDWVGISYLTPDGLYFASAEIP